MPLRKISGLIAAFRERHHVYTLLLCQLIIAAVTFYCAIVISHYDPISTSTARAVAVRSSSNDANSTTPHCKTGVHEAFEGLDTLLIEITPYSVLCPSTTLFLVSFISFWFVGWQTVLVGLQVTLPLLIWSATLLLPIGHWLCKMFLPGIYWRYRQCMRSQREELWKIINCRGEMGDVDTERGAEEGTVDEQTSLMADEGRT